MRFLFVLFQLEQRNGKIQVVKIEQQKKNNNIMTQITARMFGWWLLCLVLFWFVTLYWKYSAHTSVVWRANYESIAIDSIDCGIIGGKEYMFWVNAYIYVYRFVFLVQTCSDLYSHSVSSLLWFNRIIMSHCIIEHMTHGTPHLTAIAMTGVFV